MILKSIQSSKITTDANLRSVFKPFYLILSLLGLFPFSVQLHNIKPSFIIIQKSIYLNIACSLFHIIIMSLFLVIHVIYIVDDSEENAFTEAIMTQLNYILELLADYMVCIVAYISFYTHRYKFLQILNTLSNLIETSKINRERVLKRLRFQVKFVLGILSFLLILQIAINFTRTDSFWKMVLVAMSFIYPQMIQFTYLAYFHFLLITAVEVLRGIDEELVSYGRKEKMTNLTLVISRTGNLTLREIELIYIGVFELKQMVNKVFESSILATLMQCFHSIVSEAHIVIHGVMVHNEILDDHDIANCVLWIFYQVMKIYVVANAGNLFKLQAIRLCRSIHNLPTEKEELRFFMEVQHLVAMMSVRDMELTVFGYFSLDASLMFKVFASAGMYVIILVQFDKKS